MFSDVRSEAESAAQLVADAGGEIVGRTRLQKIAFLLEVMELGSGFEFEYKHYGPYSERLTSAIKYADLFELVHEDIKPTAWGGFYSIFRVGAGIHVTENNQSRAAAITLGNAADPVELELAATAVLLAIEGEVDPWKETEVRKPDKAAHGKLQRSKELLKKFRAISAGDKLPAIV